MFVKDKAVLVQIGNAHYTEITPANGSDFTLEELYKHLDTDLVEVVHLEACETSDEAIMIVDEEARFKGKTFNALASAEFYHRRMFLQEIYGDAIICDPAMFK